MKLLIDSGATVNASGHNVWGCTPLHEASFYGHTPIVEILLTRGADVNAKNMYGSTPLHEAASKGYPSIVQLLLAHKPIAHSEVQASLHAAAASGHIAVVKQLLEYGADVNAQGFDRAIPLHQAVLHGQAEVAYLLLSAGSDTTALRCNQTPLNLARHLLMTNSSQRDNARLKMYNLIDQFTSDQSTILAMKRKFEAIQKQPTASPQRP